MFLQPLRSPCRTRRCSASRRLPTAPFTVAIWHRVRLKSRSKRSLALTAKFKRFASLKTKATLSSGGALDFFLFISLVTTPWRPISHLLSFPPPILLSLYTLRDSFVATDATAAALSLYISICHARYRCPPLHPSSLTPPLPTTIHHHRVEHLLFIGDSILYSLPHISYPPLRIRLLGRRRPSCLISFSN